MAHNGPSVHKMYLEIILCFKTFFEMDVCAGGISGGGRSPLFVFVTVFEFFFHCLSKINFETIEWCTRPFYYIK